jgi:hypothetical protein
LENGLGVADMVYGELVEVKWNLKWERKWRRRIM